MKMSRSVRDYCKGIGLTKWILNQPQNQQEGKLFPNGLRFTQIVSAADHDHDQCGQGINKQRINVYTYLLVLDRGLKCARCVGR